MLHRLTFDPRRVASIDAALRHARPDDVRQKMLMSPRMMPAGVGGGGGGFATPDIVDRASFELGFQPLYDGNGSQSLGFYGFGDQTYGTGITQQNAFRFERTQDQAHSGTWSVVRGWTSGNPNETNAVWAFTTPQLMDRIYHAFWYKISGSLPNTPFKFMRWYGSGWNVGRGGLFGYLGTFVWEFDLENSAIPAFLDNVVIDNNWHHIEYDYWRNGHPSGFPAARIWQDGIQLGQISQADSGVAYWDADGFIVAGERTSNATVVSSPKMRYIEMCHTLNSTNSPGPAQTAVGEVYMDEMSFSSQRIGPL